MMLYSSVAASRWLPPHKAELRGLPIEYLMALVSLQTTLTQNQTFLSYGTRTRGHSNLKAAWNPNRNQDLDDFVLEEKVLVSRRL